MYDPEYWDKYNNLRRYVEENFHTRTDQKILGLPSRKDTYTDSFEKILNSKSGSSNNISGGNGNIKINGRDYGYSKSTGEIVGYQPKKKLGLGSKLVIGAGLSLGLAYGLSQIEYREKKTKGTGRFNHT